MWGVSISGQMNLQGCYTISYSYYPNGVTTKSSHSSGGLKNVGAQNLWRGLLFSEIISRLDRTVGNYSKHEWWEATFKLPI